MLKPGAGPVGPERFRWLVALPILAVGLLWAFWPALAEMVGRWSYDPRYSHGFLVPAFAAFLLWKRRADLTAGAHLPSWWGLLILGAGAALKLAGTRYYLFWVDAASLLVMLAGLALLLGGWSTLKWALPSVIFLGFMIPLPYRVEQALGAPLQRIATLSSTYLLQTVGLPAVAEGNIILIGDYRLGVVEACNGLGMLFMFLAFAVGVVLVLRRGLVDKVVIVLSAIPIALVANILRISLTGLLHETAGGRVADVVYHDLAGWLMMPMALGAIWLEILLLDHLFVETAARKPVPVVLASRGEKESRRSQPRSGNGTSAASNPEARMGRS